MRTRCLLIRHGHVDTLGRVLVARRPGVHLSEAGRQQARDLAARLADLRVERLFCSPLERTQETAEPLAEAWGLSIETREELIEVDFGEWAGRRFDELAADPHWRRYRRSRTAAPVPGGELQAEVQTRMAGFVNRMHREGAGGLIALVSHGDPIRALLAHFAGVPLDLAGRLEVHPASVSMISLDEDGPHIELINHTAESPRSSSGLR